MLNKIRDAAMKRETFKYGPWVVEYTAEDGGRLDRLSYEGYDLLTVEPKQFRPPAKDYGEYETRPVYGYDDCFPSVEPSPFPDMDWIVPDHGEICWLSWKVDKKPDSLIFSVNSEKLPVSFIREMKFSENAIVWNFKIVNHGNKIIPFLHVIHPLMPLNEIADFSLPNFKTLFDSIAKKEIPELNTPEAVKEYLFKQKVGKTNMFFLREIEGNELTLTFKNNLQLKMIYPLEQFSSIGIWWNNSAYPDEDGCRRNECAFEPIPGLTSNLKENYETNRCWFVSPGETFSWQLIWEFSKK